MFWNHENQEATESIGRCLGQEIRLRLRAAADFATLGAYDLLEADERPVERAASEPPPKRILLFAKVAPVCPHSASVVPACKKRLGSGRSPRRSRGRQRAGSARAPEQPCMCAGERLSSA
jgi:hypothetical protein